MESEVVINEHVDSLLSKMEVIFKDAVEGNKPLQEELNAEVKKLMDAYDEKDDVKKFESVKAIVDYITLTLSMPLTDETKEKVIEELTKECEEKWATGE